MLIPVIGLRWTLGVVVLAIGVPGAIGLVLPSLSPAGTRPSLGASSV